jgi:hypothetical protein
MKTILAFAAALVAWTAGAQSYVNYRLTAFTNAAPGVYTAATNISIGTNVIVQLLNFQVTSVLTGGTIALQYPAVPAVTLNMGTDQYLNLPLLGPCTATVRINASTNTNAFASFLVQFDTVNAAVSPGGTMVQPSGFTATIGLQTSTDLTAWNIITNASFGKTNGNRFFRMSLTIP